MAQIVPLPMKPADDPARRGLRKAGGCVSVVAVLVALGWLAARCEDARLSRVRRALAAIQAEHGGKVAWMDDSGQVCWRELGRDGYLGEVSTVQPTAKPRRVAWSSDGATIYAVLETGTFDTVHRIEAIDAATGAMRTILDLGKEKLEDDDIDVDQFWVAAHGEAESEQDRITFRLGKGYWYSVEGKRPRVRPVAGAPAAKWDQERCPDGKHELEHGSNDDDSWLEIDGESEDVRVTAGDANPHGAWWMPGR